MPGPQPKRTIRTYAAHYTAIDQDQLIDALDQHDNLTLSRLLNDGEQVHHQHDIDNPDACYMPGKPRACAAVAVAAELTDTQLDPRPDIAETRRSSKRAEAVNKSRAEKARRPSSRPRTPGMVPFAQLRHRDIIAHHRTREPLVVAGKVKTDTMIAGWLKVRVLNTSNGIYQIYAQPAHVTVDVTGWHGGPLDNDPEEAINDVLNILTTRRPRRR